MVHEAISSLWWRSGQDMCPYSTEEASGGGIEAQREGKLGRQLCLLRGAAQHIW